MLYKSILVRWNLSVELGKSQDYTECKIDIQDELDVGFQY